MTPFNKILTIAALTTLATTSLSSASFADDSAKEKCYGVAKAGKNDCASGQHKCAGSATVDSDKTAFIAVPKGLCERLVGGSLMAK